MTAEERRLEDLKQMAAYLGPIVSFDVREPYYLASCDHCGWVGSSELCGTDSFGDDSDVYCPRCQSSGADCGKIAERLATPSPAQQSGEHTPVGEQAMDGERWGIETVRDMDPPRGAWDWIGAVAEKYDGPHRRLDNPNDAETIIFWHNEQPVAFVLNIRDQFNNSIQFRAALSPTTDHSEQA